MLETSRLVLRPFRESDFPDVHTYASDPEVVRYMEWGPNTADQTRAFLEQAIAGAGAPLDLWKSLDLAVQLKDGERVIGSCALHRDGSACGDAALGYCFNKAYWARGYATEAAAALLAFAFKEIGLHRVYATCSPENTTSARVLEKLGMAREGYLRENRVARDRRRDSLLFAGLSTDRYTTAP